MKIETVYAIILPDNYRAIDLMKKMGFEIKHTADGTVEATLNLREEEEIPCKGELPAQKAANDTQTSEVRKETELIKE
jgi:RimJ/RimL family protein N-acetyltransferase